MLLLDAEKSFVESLYNFIISNIQTSIRPTIIKKNRNQIKGDFCFPAETARWLAHLPANFKHDKTNVKVYTRDDVLKHLHTCAHTNVLLEASTDWSFNIVSKSCDADRVNVFLNRPLSVKVALVQCIKNDEIIKKAFPKEEIQIIDHIFEQNADSLTGLRVNLVRNVVKNLAKLNLNDDGKVLDVLVTAGSTLEVRSGTCLVLCGPVLNMKTGTKEATVTPLDYVKKRQNEMMLIAQHKYGVRASTDYRWRDLKSQLGEAAVAFELLQIKPYSAVKIDFDKPTSGSSKGAAFVLYNCARLETLVSAFEEKVAAKYYPPPPDINDTDFNLLSNEEWHLLFTYVLGFPGVLASCMRLEGTSVALAPHHLCTFVSSLVRSFSQYYQRTKVLTEARVHLMPVMYARIQLLTALSLTLKAALRVLNIGTVSRM